MKFGIEHIVGHRGAKLNAPENSLGGFEYLRSLGIHKVELDVQLSRDGHAVVFHDHNLGRLCNLDGHICDYDVTELQSMNCAVNFPGWHPIEPIPTLERVLSAWPELTHIQIEVKTPTKASQAQAAISALLNQIKTLVKFYQLERVAVITAKSMRVLELNLNTGKICAQGLVYEPPQLPGEANPITLAQSLKCEYLMPYYPLVNAQMAHEAKDQNLTLSTWTVNDLNTARSLIEEVHLNSIITDNVHNMLEFVS